MTTVAYPQVEAKQVVNDFNKTLTDLIKNIAYICPESTVGKDIKIYSSILKIFKKSTKFIDIFVEKALIYKGKLDNNDVSFLLDNDYDNEIDNLDKDVKKNTIDIIVECKDVWPKINKDNQEVVIAYLKLLCTLAQEYFMIMQTGKPN
jgi:hypothetical protein